MQLLLFGVTIVATRVLSIEAFGAYALASLFVILARALFYVGPYEYLLKSQHESDLYSACFGANVVLAVFSCLILTAFYFAAPHIFQTDNVSMLVALLTPSIFLVATTAWYEAVLLRAVRVRRYYLSNLAGDVAGSAAAVALLLDGFGVASLVVQTYVRLLVLLAIYVFSTSDRPHLGAGLGRIGTVLRWSRTRYAAVLLNFTSAYGADMVLGATLTPAVTGLYRASNRIVSALTDLFAQPLQKIAQTNLSATYVREQPLGTSWLTMLSGVGAIAWAGLLTLAFLADDLVPFALGAKWAPAVPIVIVFCIVKAFSMLDAVTTAFLVCHDQQRMMLRVQIGTAAAVLLLALTASPWGPVAVAIAVGIAMTSISVIYGIMVWRLSKAEADAIVDLIKTSAPPVLWVALGLTALKTLAPAQEGIEAVVTGAAVAALGFAIGIFSVRHRMLSAIGSLGHVPGQVQQAGQS